MNNQINEKAKINIWMYATIVLTVLLIISLVQGWSIKRIFTSSRLETGTKTTQPEQPQIDKEEKCPCGCNMKLEDCSCATAQQLKENKTSPSSEPISPPQQVSVDDDPFIGSKDAPVTIIEFSDFQCPFCKRAEPTIKQILETYGDKIRFVYRDFPLTFHQNAQKAAEAAECADEQGKFWEYHDLLFEKQTEWSSDGVKKFKEYAVQLNLNTKDFNDCLDSGKMISEVNKDFQDGQSYGVTGTPTFFINNELISGAQPFEVFKQKIEEALGY